MSANRVRSQAREDLIPHCAGIYLVTHERAICDCTVHMIVHVFVGHHTDVAGSRELCVESRYTAANGRSKAVEAFITDKDPLP